MSSAVSSTISSRLLGWQALSHIGPALGDTPLGQCGDVADRELAFGPMPPCARACHAEVGATHLASSYAPSGRAAQRQKAAWLRADDRAGLRRGVDRMQFDAEAHANAEPLHSKRFQCVCRRSARAAEQQG